EHVDPAVNGAAGRRIDIGVASAIYEIAHVDDIGIGKEYRHSPTGVGRPIELGPDRLIPNVERPTIGKGDFRIRLISLYISILSRAALILDRAGVRNQLLSDRGKNLVAAGMIRMVVGVEQGMDGTFTPPPEFSEELL